MKNTPTFQAASLMVSIILIAPLLTQAEPMTSTAPALRGGIGGNVAQRTAPKDQSALAKAPRIPTLAGLGTFAEVRSLLPQAGIAPRDD